MSELSLRHGTDTVNGLFQFNWDKERANESGIHVLTNGSVPRFRLALGRSTVPRRATARPSFFAICFVLIAINRHAWSLIGFRERLSHRSPATDSLFDRRTCRSRAANQSLSRQERRSSQSCRSCHLCLRQSENAEASHPDAGFASKTAAVGSHRRGNLKPTRCRS
jgi:hypothetical protein